MLRSIYHLHIPKTGGQSLASVLSELRRKKLIDLIHSPTPTPLAGVPISLFHPPLLMQKIMRIRHQTLEDVFSIPTNSITSKTEILTTVRDPWDRAVSLFHYVYRGLMRNYDATFLQFVHALPVLMKDEFWGFMFRPQVDYLIGSETTIFRLENINKDLFEWLSNKKFPNIPMKNYNKTSTRPNTPLSSFYTRELSNKIESIYLADVEKFNYENFL